MNTDSMPDDHCWAPLSDLSGASLIRMLPADQTNRALQRVLNSIGEENVLSAFGSFVQDLAH